ncbi:VCBS repeat-containing protein [Actinomadura sp. DC4]|uniref:FG-GAP repeat domain-containing protein n=1 Tax=Actinomadura sp. DC4 TaxID=3055069 RepID=UPI0025B1CC38|nr:VCBS repeat-containing protein [Actinomadura sp. DC4]MDN3357684.1 VCBS repeat-containing protein [Actinomadura sp. DC4]
MAIATACVLGLTGTASATPNEVSPPGVAIAAEAGPLGGRATLTLAPCAGALESPPAACAGTFPARYTYQVNSGAPQSVPATGGVQTVQIPLHHLDFNTLTVYGYSAAGNSGEPASAEFIVGEPATPYADGDIDGDGHADLLFAGTDADPGLWLARGDGAGGLGTPANIGTVGTGQNGGPEDWTGAQVLHGDFTGDHVQDVLAYYPDGSVPGRGSLSSGNGDALPLEIDGQKNVPEDQFTDYSLNGDGDVPAQLVAAGDASLAGTGIADLIGITGDEDNDYQLDLYTTCGGCGVGGYGYTQTLAGPGESPDGDGDWKDFALVTAQPGGQAVLFALKRTTGQVWESVNPAQSAATPIGTPGTWTEIDVPWAATAVPTLVSGDVNAAGQVELWALDGRDATPYTLSGTALSREG